MPGLPIDSAVDAERLSRCTRSTAFPSLPIGPGTPGGSRAGPGKRSRVRGSATGSGSRSAGNSTTSRIERRPHSSITSRSMPRPTPPVGGMPCSSAARKGSSNGGASSARRRLALREEAGALLVGVVELAERVGELDPAGEGLPALDEPLAGAVALRERRELQRIVEDERRLLEGRLDVRREQVVDERRPAATARLELEARRRRSRRRVRAARARPSRRFRCARGSRRSASRGATAG